MLLDAFEQRGQPSTFCRGLSQPFECSLDLIKLLPHHLPSHSGVVVLGRSCWSTFFTALLMMAGWTVTSRQESARSRPPFASTAFGNPCLGPESPRVS